MCPGTMDNQQLLPEASDNVVGCCNRLVQSCGKVIAFASLPRVLERLGSMSAQLESCQRALNEFLEEKRAAFPRQVPLRA